MSRVASTVAPPDAVMPKRHPKAPAAKSQIPSHFGHCFGCGELHVTGLHFKGIAGENLDLTSKNVVTNSLTPGMEDAACAVAKVLINFHLHSRPIEAN